MSTRLSKLEQHALHMSADERRQWKLDIAREYGANSNEFRLVCAAVRFANEREVENKS